MIILFCFVLFTYRSNSFSFSSLGSPMGENSKTWGGFQSEEKNAVALRGHTGSHFWCSSLLAPGDLTWIWLQRCPITCGFYCCFCWANCCPAWMRLARSFRRGLVLGIPKELGRPKSSLHELLNLGIIH